MVSNIKQLDLQKKYSYADYINWQFEEMVELIRGQVYKMSPAPNKLHQEVSAELLYQIKHYLRGRSCKVFHAPFDVRLALLNDQNENDKIDTVVQPDITVICDLSKLDEQGCNGAPDWVIEILSKSTAEKDLKEKFKLYEHAGVQEYWIVHPREGTILAYSLNTDGRYELLHQRPYVGKERIPSTVLSGLKIDLNEVFS